MSGCALDVDTFWRCMSDVRISLQWNRGPKRSGLLHGVDENDTRCHGLGQNQVVDCPFIDAGMRMTVILRPCLMRSLTCRRYVRLYPAPPRAGRALKLWRGEGYMTSNYSDHHRSFLAYLVSHLASPSRHVTAPSPACRLVVKAIHSLIPQRRTTQAWAQMQMLSHAAEASLCV